ncbi:MAG TPA: hypothetical protein VFW60_04190 [Rhodanobacteraceae bacterium]|nr:hypothetical protein [Rhodanobacteraceae bacterium]
MTHRASLLVQCGLPNGGDRPQAMAEAAPRDRRRWTMVTPHKQFVVMLVTDGAWTVSNGASAGMDG